MTNEQLAVQLLADYAEELGATANDEDRKVRELVSDHGLGFNAWFCVCCELADRAAKRQGYSSEVARAFSVATARLAQ